MRGQIRQGTVTLRGVMTIRKRGQVYRYLRRKGHPLVALPSLPLDHPEFLAAYAAALGAPPGPATVCARAPAASIAAVCDAVPAEAQYRGSGAAYRQMLDRHLAAIRAQAEDAMIADLAPRHILADLAPLTPAVARARLKAWRIVCATAGRLGLIDNNPALGLRAPAMATLGHEAWTPDHLAAFRARWPVGTPQRGCMELLHWTGARRSDAVRLGPGMVGRDGVLAYRQGKTKAVAFVPWNCALPAYADPADLAEAKAALAPLAGQMTFLATAQGRSRSANGMGMLLQAACAAAEVPRSAHGLRKTRAVRLAEGGATAHQIAAWTGHQSLSEVEHYTREADRRRAVIGTERGGNDANAPGDGANRAG